MKRYLSAFLGLVVLAALGFLAFRELRQDQETGLMKKGDLIFPINPSRVASLTIKISGNDAVFRKSGGNWERVSGSPEADPGFVDAFLAGWSRVRFLEEVEEDPAPAKIEEYGLSGPDVVAEAILRPSPDGAATEAAHSPRLELGKKSPLLPALYARIDGRPRVLLVSADAMELIEGVGKEIFGEKPNRPESRPSPVGGPARSPVPL